MGYAVFRGRNDCTGYLPGILDEIAAECLRSLKNESLCLPVDYLSGDQ